MLKYLHCHRKSVTIKAFKRQYYEIKQPILKARYLVYLQKCHAARRNIKVM